MAQFFNNIYAGLLFVWQFVVDLFSTNITELPIWKIVVAALIVLVVLWLLKIVVKALWSGVKAFLRALGKLCRVNKAKCEKIVCPSCGRTLANCVCEKNKKRGYGARIRDYKKQIKK